MIKSFKKTTVFVCDRGIQSIVIPNELYIFVTMVIKMESSLHMIYELMTSVAKDLADALQQRLGMAHRCK